MGLSAATIKSYLSGVRQVQLARVCGPSTVSNAKVTTHPSWGMSRTKEGGANLPTPPTNYPRDFEKNEDSLGIRGHLLGHDNAVGHFIGGILLVLPVREAYGNIREKLRTPGQPDS